jgi:archaellum component FlaC
MKRQNKYRKFQLQQKNIEALEKENSRFKRVYSEYENMSNEFGILKTPAENPFLMILSMQWYYRLPIWKMK